MRPLERGPCPLDATGQPICFAEYADARRDLIERLGDYCAYCEVRQSNALTIDHVEPRRHAPQRERDWDNLLPACANCNGTKGARILDVYLPDRDNTARAFQYGEEGLLSPHSDLEPEQREKARRTLKLLGLDRTPAHGLPATDRRWLNRREAWNIARRSLEKWQRKRDDPDTREFIIALARSQGHWSIWMAVFENEPGLRQALIDAFPGTCRTCFDKNTRSVGPSGWLSLTGAWLRAGARGAAGSCAGRCGSSSPGPGGS
jgi:uncharacterized protein (TIGR02646 family)